MGAVGRTAGSRRQGRLPTGGFQKEKKRPEVTAQTMSRGFLGWGDRAGFTHEATTR